MLYEKLEVWQRSRQLTIEVYKAFEGCRDFDFKDQITKKQPLAPSEAPPQGMHMILKSILFLSLAGM
jgi:hypothetical protein